jgi:hypothetical protein
MTKMNKYGIPLDCLRDWTKLDWEMWLAGIASSVGRHKHFEMITDAVFRWANETKSRVPLSDFYWTTTGQQAGFQARPVVGGIYTHLLLKALQEKMKLIDY